MTQKVVFMVFGDLDLDLWPIFTKKKSKVSWVCRIYGKKIILIGAKLWPVGGVTDRQTDKRTNGTDQYTLRKRPSGFRKVTNGTDQYTLRKVVDFRKVITAILRFLNPSPLSNSYPIVKTY